MGCAWDLARQLVQIDSSNPGAYEHELEQTLMRLISHKVASLPTWLAEAIIIDELEVLPNRRNLRVQVPARVTADPAPRLVFICHMDTVTLGEDWDATTPPLGGARVGDKLYGRGACDMKSGLACAVSALFSAFDQAAEKGVLPDRSLVFIGTVDEETEMRGVEAAIRTGWVGENDWVLDTEPTDGQLQVAHKGRTWLEITVHGVTAHASQPWEGADAIAAMAELITDLRRSVAAWPHHDELGFSTITFGQIEGGYQPYVVPDACRVWVDARLVPPASTELLLEAAHQAAAKAEQSISGVTATITVTGDRAPVEKDPASPLLKALTQSHERVTGTPCHVGFFTGYTDTAVIASTCKNKNCMSYGPGSLAEAHKPNEFVKRSEVERVEAVLIDLVNHELWGVFMPAASQC